MTKSLADMQAEILKVNTANGWFDTERSVGDDIALLHSEVSEAFEAYRDHGTKDVTWPLQAPGERRGAPPKPEGFGSELADILIRLLDTCERHGIDLEAEYERKIIYNRSRGYRHGGKRV